MSSYLTFYLVPKKTKKKYDFNKDDGSTEIEVELSKGEPLCLTSYSRSSEIYQAYKEKLNPAYAGNDENYTELRYEDAKSVCTSYEKEINETKKRLEIDYKIIKEGGYNSDLWEEIHSFEKYLDDQKETLQELKSISNLVYDVYMDYTDFEKVLINIG